MGLKNVSIGKLYKIQILFTLPNCDFMSLQLSYSAVAVNTCSYLGAITKTRDWEEVATKSVTRTSLIINISAEFATNKRSSCKVWVYHFDCIVPLNCVHDWWPIIGLSILCKMLPMPLREFKKCLTCF